MLSNSILILSLLAAMWLIGRFLDGLFERMTAHRCSASPFATDECIQIHGHPISETYRKYEWL